MRRRIAPSRIRRRRAGCGELTGVWHRIRRCSSGRSRISACPPLVPRPASDRSRISLRLRGEGEDRQMDGPWNRECGKPASSRADRLAEDTPTSVGRPIRNGLHHSCGPTRTASNRPGERF